MVALSSEGGFAAQTLPRSGPSVGVVIPAHNAAETLARALDSVLAQSRPPQEIIVVDDASTDDTASIAESYRVRGVRVVARGRCGGAAAARNAGIRAATSDWIAFLDADDEWLPGKLERQLQAAGQGTSFVFCASHEIAPEGRFLGDTYGGRPVVEGPQAWKALLASNFVATPTVMARRALLLEVGGFDESLKVAEDQDMWIRLALAGAPAYVPESLVTVHVRPQSLSSWSLTDQYEFTLPMIERHLQRLTSRLSRRETRAIMGERYTRIGLAACDNGRMAEGIAMLLTSVRHGYRPLYGLMLAVKIPLAALLRRMMPRRAPSLAP